MKHPRFAYARPASLDEALALLAADDDAKVLAGGQSLLPVMALRLGAPGTLVDLGGVPGLDRIDLGDDGSVTIGALVRHAEVEDSPAVQRHAPLLSSAMPHIGHRAIRNQGTAVGSIAHADPAAELPAVCRAVGATMIAESVRGRREIDAADFFQGFLDTALEPDEVLTAVRFPPWPDHAAGIVVEEARRHGDYALVGLAAAVARRDGIVEDASLSFFSVGPTPIRAADAEESLLGGELDAAAIDRAAAAVAAALEPPADVHASANYRRHLAGVLTRRALTSLSEETR